MELKRHSDVGAGSLEFAVQDPVKMKMCTGSFQKPYFLCLPPGETLPCLCLAVLEMVTVHPLKSTTREQWNTGEP